MRYDQKMRLMGAAFLLANIFSSGAYAALSAEDQQKISAIQMNPQKNWEDVQRLWNHSNRHQQEVRAALRPILEAMVAQKATYWRKAEDLLNQEGNSGNASGSGVAASQPARPVASAPAEVAGGSRASSSGAPRPASPPRAVPVPAAAAAAVSEAAPSHAQPSASDPNMERARKYGLPETQELIEAFHKNPRDLRTLEFMMAKARDRRTSDVDKATLLSLALPELHDIFQTDPGNQWMAADILWNSVARESRQFYRQLEAYYLRLAQDNSPQNNRQIEALEQLWRTPVRPADGADIAVRKRNQAEVTRIAKELIRGAGGPAKQEEAFGLLYRAFETRKEAENTLVAAAEDPGPGREEALRLLQQYFPERADRVVRYRRVRGEDEASAPASQPPRGGSGGGSGRGGGRPPAAGGSESSSSAAFGAEADFG